MRITQYLENKCQQGIIERKQKLIGGFGLSNGGGKVNQVQS